MDYLPSFFLFCFQKLLENPMASFRIKLKFVWTKKTGKVSRVGTKKTSTGKSGENEDSTMESADTAV